jgi:hypothetical protein
VDEVHPRGNLTKNDNVCIAAQDIDGDGKCEVAVGAEWNPGDTVNSGAVFYLIPPADRTQKWEPVKFPSVEPTTHRMKWIKLGEGMGPRRRPAARARQQERRRCASQSAVYHPRRRRCRRVSGKASRR